MKANKLCFSKAFAVTVPMILILLGVVLFSNYLNKQKLSTNSRAAKQNACYFEGREFIPNVSQKIDAHKFMYDPLSRCMKQGPKDALDSTLVNIGVICNENTGIAQMNEIICKVPLDSPVWVLGNPEATTEIPADTCIFEGHILDEVKPTIIGTKKYVISTHFHGEQNGCIRVKYVSDSNDVPYTNIGLICSSATSFKPKISDQCPTSIDSYEGMYMPAKKVCKLLRPDGSSESLEVGKISTPLTKEEAGEGGKGNIGYTYSIDLNGCILSNSNKPGSVWKNMGNICNAETDWEQVTSRHNNGVRDICLQPGEGVCSVQTK